MNKMKRFLIVTLFISTFMACSGDDNKEGISANVEAPSDITIERLDNTKIIVRWKDNSNNETGFSIWVRNAANANDRQEVGTVSTDITEYIIEEGLTEGNSYYFGVQAKATSEENNSRVIYQLYNLQPLGNLPKATLASTAANAACISISYQISNTSGQTNVKYGLCWSAEGTPTTNDNKQYGPKLPTDGSSILQVIPNTLLEYDKTYKIRAFVSTSTGVYYSTETSTKLEAAPASIELVWNKLSKSTLPSEIELYETTSLLNGKKFHAWYAVGDLSTGKIELRVNVPTTATTVDDQLASFNGECYLLVNGGYFYNGRHTGIAVVNAVATGSISAVRGSLKSSDTEEYNSMYNVTRGIIGVDASGKPGVYWSGTDTNGKVYYFDRPLPSVKGEAKYDIVGSENPSEPVTWVPQYALSAGPVLLKDGKCPFNFTETAKGADYYLSNYEIIPYDIFGPTVSPDRTAVGYREDGKVVLFICDGRIAASGGATLTELAQIMKGLKCIGAVNLDGGGSTGMVVGNEHLNNMSEGNRAVVSTIGFFKK